MENEMELINHLAFFGGPRSGFPLGEPREFTLIMPNHYGEQGILLTITWHSPEIGVCRWEVGLVLTDELIDVDRPLLTPYGGTNKRPHTKDAVGTCEILLPATLAKAGGLIYLLLRRNRNHPEDTLPGEEYFLSMAIDEVTL